MTNTSIFGTALLIISTLSSITSCKRDEERSAEERVTALEQLVIKGEPTIRVHPQTLYKIEGHSELKRDTFFSVASPPIHFEHDLKEEQLNTLAELKVAPGRHFEPLKNINNIFKCVQENSSKPGYVDSLYLKQKLEKNKHTISQEIISSLGQIPSTVALGDSNAFPDFMGKVTTPEASSSPFPKSLPENLKAATDLSARFFLEAYTESNRPTYYAPLSEPHWSFLSLPHFANWHLEALKTFRAHKMPIEVGGPAHAISSYSRFGYHSFKGMQKFIDNTRGELDFYSFHVYDYYVDVDAGKNATEINSGKALENTLDLVSNYGFLNYNREFPIVISEHGAFALGGNNPKGSFRGSWHVNAIRDHAKTKKPDGFKGEMEDRNISVWSAVSAQISNVLAMVDYPHIIRKAVPFIVLSSHRWDPSYRSSLYVPENYDPELPLLESYLMNYYRFFKGVSGQRVFSENFHPDLQTSSFLKGEHIYTAINNLSNSPHQVDIQGLSGTRYTIRRLTRTEKWLPEYTETTTDSIEGLKIRGREAIMIISKNTRSHSFSHQIDETIHYGNQVMHRIVPQKKSHASVEIEIDSLKTARSAILKIGYSRLVDASPELSVSMNSAPLDIEPSISAERYATQKSGMTGYVKVHVPQELLKSQNSIKIKFPDQKGGTVGSVILRVQHISKM